MRALIDRVRGRQHLVDRRIYSLKSDRIRYLDGPRTVEAAPFPIFGPHSLKPSGPKRLPPRYIAHLDHARIVSRGLSIITGGRVTGSVWATSDDLLLSKNPVDYSDAFKRRGRHWLLADRKMPVTRAAEGTLIGDRFTFNYFHFLTSSLGRLALDQRENPSGNSPLVFDYRLAPQMRELLDLMAPGRPLIEIPRGGILQVDSLVVPQVSTYSPDVASEAHAAVYDADILQDVRRRLMPHSSPSRRRVLFLSRRNWANYRNVLNEAEVEEFFGQLGVEIIQPGEMTIQDQISAFSSADIIISIAGAALGNMLFCHPGTKVIIISANRDVSPDYFGIMATSLGLDMAVVACQAVAGTHENAAHQSFQCGLQHLRQALDWAGLSAKGSPHEPR